MIVKRDVGGNNKTIEIEVPSDRNVWRIAFQHGENAWGYLGGNVNSTIEIHSIEIIGQQQSKVATVKSPDAAMTAEAVLGPVAKEVMGLIKGDELKQPFNVTDIQNKLSAKTSPQAVRDILEDLVNSEDALIIPVEERDGYWQKTNVGGINLDPALLDLQIKRDGNGVPLPLNQQPLDMKIEGVLPVIIDVKPIDLPLMLGLAEEEPINTTQGKKETAPTPVSRSPQIPAEPRKRLEMSGSTIRRS